VSAARFDPDELADADEPVRRYFAHALAPGTPLGGRVRLRMRGRIRVGRWLRFTADWEGDGRSFAWRAAAGPRGVLRVLDRYAAGAACTDVRLLGRIGLVHADGADTIRSGAGRAAVEGIWAPASLLPASGVRWRAEGDALVAGRWDVPPERPEVWLRLDRDGAVRSACVER
jgi:hypothetical protein